MTRMGPGQDSLFYCFSGFFKNGGVGWGGMKSREMAQQLRNLLFKKQSPPKTPNYITTKVN